MSLLKLSLCSFISIFIISGAYSLNSEFKETNKISIQEFANTYYIVFNKKEKAAATDKIQRKDVLLKIFFPVKGKYRLSFRTFLKHTNTNISEKNKDNFIRLIDFYYAPSINKKAFKIFPEINIDKPYLYRNKIHFNYSVLIRKIGLYFIKVKAGIEDKYTPTKAEFIIVRHNVQIPALRSLMTTYFSTLQSINSIIRFKRYDSKFSSSEKEKLKFLIKVLKRIRIQVKMLTHSEKEIFRKRIMNHRQTRIYINNIKRLKIPLSSENIKSK